MQSDSRRKMVDIAHESAKLGLALLILSLLLVRVDQGVFALEVTSMILILCPQVIVLRYSKRKSERHSAMRTLGLVLLLLVIGVVYLYLA